MLDNLAKLFQAIELDLNVDTIISDNKVRTPSSLKNREDQLRNLTTANKALHSVLTQEVRTKSEGLRCIDVF